MKKLCIIQFQPKPVIRKPCGHVKLGVVAIATQADVTVTLIAVMVPTKVTVVSSADRVYVSLGTAGTYPGYGPVYRNVPW